MTLEDWSGSGVTSPYVELLPAVGDELVADLGLQVELVLQEGVHLLHASAEAVQERGRRLLCRTAGAGGICGQSHRLLVTH